MLPIIKQHIRPGSEVHSDEWAAYRQVVGLAGVGAHNTVNHTLGFVNPYNGAHTQPVERYWCKAKMKLKAMKGIKRQWLAEYLDEFIWSEYYGRYGPDTMNNVLDHISEFYPQ